MGLLAFAESDWCGKSGFTHNHLPDMALIRVAILAAAHITVRELAKPFPRDVPQSPAVYKVAFNAAIERIRKVVATIEILTETVEASDSLITCWGQPDCEIVATYPRLTPHRSTPGRGATRRLFSGFFGHPFLTRRE